MVELWHRRSTATAAIRIVHACAMERTADERDECERLGQLFAKKCENVVTREYFACQLDAFYTLNGEEMEERATALFECISSARAPASLVAHIISDIDTCDFRLSTIRALCTNLYRVVPCSTTIAMIHAMCTPSTTLSEPSLTLHNVARIPHMVGDALLCYIDCAVPMLGAHRPHTMHLVCATLAKRTHRAWTAEIEDSLLAAVKCTWASVRGLDHYAPMPTNVSALGTYRIASSVPDPRLYCDDACKVQLLPRCAVEAHHRGTSPFYAVGGAALLDFLFSATLNRQMEDLYVQEFLSLVPLAALMYVAEHALHTHAYPPRLISAHMKACNPLWDVLSPTCAEDMALFAPGALASICARRGSDQPSFMRHMGASWGHVARAFYSYVDARTPTGAIQSYVSKSPPQWRLDTAWAVIVLRYLSAEEVHATMRTGHIHDAEVRMALAKKLIDDGQSALLLHSDFLTCLVQADACEARYFCASLSPADWSAAANTCGTMLVFDKKTICRRDRRQTLHAISEFAPNWMKQFRGSADGPTASERLIAMRDSLPDWDAWNLDDLLDRLTPSSHAKRAHMQ